MLHINKKESPQNAGKQAILWIKILWTTLLLYLQKDWV